MVDISVEKYTNAKVCTIRMSNKKLCWVIMYDIQEGTGVKNMSDLVRKEIRGIFRTKNPTKDQIRKYKRREKKLDHNSTATVVYVHSNLMSRIIKKCRGEKRETKNINNFRCKLGFKLHDIIKCKEASVTLKIIKVFPNKKILLQYPVLNYQIDLHFSEHKLEKIKEKKK